MIIGTKRWRQISKGLRCTIMTQIFQKTQIFMKQVRMYGFVVFTSFAKHANFKGQLAPVAYGVKKLVATCVIEDDKVSTQDLEDKIIEIEDLVQSVDIVAFNKL